MPEQTSANRAKAFCAENVSEFFANLDIAMFKSGISYDPDRIWNMDETGCPTVATKTASTSDASSMPSTSSAFICRALKEVTPIKRVTPAKKSNRGRKPMKSTILTSSENVVNLRQKAEEKRAKEAKKNQIEKEKTIKLPAAKRSRRTFSAPPQMESDSEEEIFCTRKEKKWMPQAKKYCSP